MTATLGAISTTRAMATPQLGAVIESQGRRKKWIADQIGVDRSHLSHIVSRRRTIGVDQANLVARILGVPFFVLFEFTSESESLTDGEGSRAA